MTKEELALEIIQRLKKEYPDAGCTLDYNQAWKLLVSVRLAAQCTDARVNVVVKDLYDRYPDVRSLADAKVEDIERIVKPCGLGHSKARDISACMKILQEGIETNKHNFTRFLVVADPWQVDELRQHHVNATNKASMVFTLPHTEGSLSQVLSILSFYNINLTKIQSLPIIGREWEYQFYVDVAFNDYLRYKQSIAAITPLTKELKLLGEYAEGKSNV